MVSGGIRVFKNGHIYNDYAFIKDSARWKAFLIKCKDFVSIIKHLVPKINHKIKTNLTLKDHHKYKS